MSVSGFIHQADFEILFCFLVKMLTLFSAIEPLCHHRTAQRYISHIVKFYWMGFSVELYRFAWQFCIQWHFFVYIFIYIFIYILYIFIYIYIIIYIYYIYIYIYINNTAVLIKICHFLINVVKFYAKPLENWTFQRFARAA